MLKEIDEEDVLDENIIFIERVLVAAEINMVATAEEIPEEIEFEEDDFITRELKLQGQEDLL